MVEIKSNNGHRAYKEIEWAKEKIRLSEVIRPVVRIMFKSRDVGWSLQDLTNKFL